MLAGGFSFSLPKHQHLHGKLEPNLQHRRESKVKHFTRNVEHGFVELVQL